MKVPGSVGDRQNRQ